MARRLAFVAVAMTVGLLAATECRGQCRQQSGGGQRPTGGNIGVPTGFQTGGSTGQPWTSPQAYNPYAGLQQQLAQGYFQQQQQKAFEQAQYRQFRRQQHLVTARERREQMLERRELRRQQLALQQSEDD